MVGDQAPAEAETLGSQLTWTLDGADRFVTIGPGWDEFARRNAPPRQHAALRARALRGQPLWSCVAGEDLRLLIEELHARVRTSGSGVTLPFRCDSPDAARHLEMRIEPAEGGALVVTTTLVRLGAHARRITALEPGRATAPADLGARDVVRSCSWCRAFWIEGRGWRPIEEAAEALGLFEKAPPAVTHAICADCRERLAAAG